MNAQTIEDLPGVGPQLAVKIRQKFRNDEAFFEAANRQDLQAISAIEGISGRRAVDLVLAARGVQAPERFLATPAARKVHERIMEKLLSYACTDVGRNRLRLLHPLPSPQIARTHMEHVLLAKQQMSEVEPAILKGALRRLQPPPPLTPHSIPGLLVVAESDEVREQLYAWGIARWAELGSLRDLHSADDYDLVVIAYDEGNLDSSDIPNAIEVPIGDGPSQICPAITIEQFQKNRPAAQACQELAQLFQTESIAEQILSILDELNFGPQTTGSITEMVETIKVELDKQLAEAVAGCSMTGPALVTAIASGAWPAEIQSIMDAILLEGKHRLHAETGLRFQPYTAGFPLGIDEEVIAEVAHEQASEKHLDQFRRQQKAARALDRLSADLDNEIHNWLEQDASFALGRFALEHDLHAPAFDDVLEFQNSIHLDMARSSSAERIAYRLGAEAPVAVLTGANSGGKSTLLEHLTQLVVMARLGLPVVGEGVHVPWLDEVHLVTARRGLDAGAFETFLRGFLPVTKGDAKRLVLADEVEAVTELDAAGRILAWVLDRLATTESLAVIVTHLSAQVLHHVTATNVRVDGIEATGLDENHQLVVNRCPVMGRSAHSTPELIVQRLAATTTGDEQQLYQDLLGAFDSANFTSHA